MSKEPQALMIRLKPEVHMIVLDAQQHPKRLTCLCKSLWYVVLATYVSQLDPTCRQRLFQQRPKRHPQGPSLINCVVLISKPWQVLAETLPTILSWWLAAAANLNFVSESAVSLMDNMRRMPSHLSDQTESSCACSWLVSLNRRHFEMSKRVQ